MNLFSPSMRSKILEPMEKGGYLCLSFSENFCIKPGRLLLPVVLGMAYLVIEGNPALELPYSLSKSVVLQVEFGNLLFPRDNRQVFFYSCLTFTCFAF